MPTCRRISLELAAVLLGGGNVLPDHPHGACRHRQQADGGPADGGLAGTRLADEADHLSGIDDQVGPFHGPEGRHPALLRVLDGDIAELQDRFALRLGRLGRGQGGGILALPPDQLVFRNGEDLDVGRGGESGGDVHVRRGIRAALAQMRDRGQQRLGVLVLRVVEDLRCRPGLHDEALAHDGDPVGEVGHHPHVVGDQHNGTVQFVPQVAHEVKDFGLDGHVEGRGRLIGNEQLRVAGERLRDHGALALAAGKLVRVGPEGLLRIGQFYKIQHAQGPESGFLRRNLIVQTHSFHDLRPHGVDRVQGRHRLLEDHRDVLAAHCADIGLVAPQQLTAGELDASSHTAVTGQQAQQRH